MHDKLVPDLIQNYFKNEILNDGLMIRTEEGAPQDGPLSHLLANIHLSSYDHELEDMDVHEAQYSDDIVILAMKRAIERLFEFSCKYLETKPEIHLGVTTLFFLVDRAMSIVYVWNLVLNECA